METTVISQVVCKMQTILSLRNVIAKYLVYRVSIYTALSNNEYLKKNANTEVMQVK